MCSTPLKPIELSPAVARRLVEDMRAFQAEPNAIKCDVAVRQLHALKSSGYSTSFEQMKKHA